MKIRAHHLLCMQGFQGLGYNEEFTKNMEEVINRIKTEPELELEITEDCDIICASCVHCESGKCRRETASHEKSLDMDKKVLKRLNLKEGMKLKAEFVFDFVNELLKNYESRKDICGQCNWQDQCLWFNSF
ncbi:MAG: DUF1284 domain-containing protein [Armatimonadota bacterium]